MKLNGELWTENEIAILKTGGSLLELHAKLPNRSLKAIQRKLARISDQLDITKEETEDEEEDTFQSTVETFKSLTKKHRPTFTHSAKGLVKPTKKYLILSDLHFPIVEYDMLMDIVQLHSDADAVILNGDILDGYVYSIFPKDRTIAAIDEYRSAFAFVKILSKFFPQVYLTEGNHDVRLAKYLQDKGIGSSASSILYPRLIERIANGEEVDRYGKLIKKHDFNNVHFDPIDAWYVRIGNAVVAHPHFKLSSSPGMGVMATAKKINNIYHDEIPDCIIIGHTHALYKGIVNAQLLIEQGCLMSYGEYAFSPRTNYNGSAELGYALLYQDDNGNTDFNNTRFVYCGQSKPNKKRKK